MGYLFPEAPIGPDLLHCSLIPITTNFVIGRINTEQLTTEIMDGPIIWTDFKILTR